MKYKASSFSIIIFFVCLSIIGIALTSLLSVQLVSSTNQKSLYVNFNWKGASAKILEQEVTSKLEGLINKVKGIKEISSFSNKGKGSINVKLKKNSDIDAIRFEISNLINQSYRDFPNGVTYPELSFRGESDNQAILSYSINADESPYYIKKYTEKNILPRLTGLNGVSSINVYGATPFEWNIKYDVNKLFQLNISVNEIENAIKKYFVEEQLGNGTLVSNIDNTSLNISLTIKYKSDYNIDWGNIPIKDSSGRVIFLKNIAKVEFNEASISSYYRINGENSINMVVYAEKGSNTINVAREVKAKVNQLEDEIQQNYTLRLAQDTTEYLIEELNKIQRRMLFSLLVLLILVLLINRSFKYLAVLFIAIIVNLLIAIIFYYLFKIELQLYSFAGITISFGVIIDNSIIMIDHYNKRKNRKVFLAILAATLTTIGALLIIFLLSTEQKENLLDFALVIMINIGVSLFVSLYFIPALLKKIILKPKKINFYRKRKISNYTKRYHNFISIIKRPFLKWIFIIILIVGFGIPIQFLPDKMDGENFVSNVYNETLGSEWFSNDIKPTLEKILGGSLRLFVRDVYGESYDSEPERTTLRIDAKMPDGCTIEQLNDVVQKMERYLKNFKEVELFETRISSYKNSRISIYFKKENEFTEFPFVLKDLIESKATNLGGVSWNVEGVGAGFSNVATPNRKFNRIVLKGYNYDRLYHFAELLKEQLGENSSRIKEVEIISSIGRGSSALYEYYLDFNDEQMAFNNVSQSEFHDFFKNQIHSIYVTSIINDYEFQQVKLVSYQFQENNLWDLKHAPIEIGENQYKLNQFARVKKKKTGNSISKKNQQYKLIVTYDFLGTINLAKKVKEDNISMLNSKLPVGYTVFDELNEGWYKEDSKQYYYLFLVLIIIFFICSILLESLRQPFAIISMIPISFIGVFLTFYLFEFNFDQGGYASFILLCGISVNSALYIINDYNNLIKLYPKRSIHSLYFKAYNYKIIPVVLTIASTVVGLIPFVWDGQREAFWFSFAVGSIGGLLFSLIAIIIYLPIFILKK